MTVVYLALGSNLGNREGHLRAGCQGLSARGVDITRSASLYSTEPREVLDQPWFLNTVIEGNTGLSPDQLLQMCLEVETENQRIRHTAKGPRTLDIDIILYGNHIVHNPGLAIPHPRFSARRFVLVPLAEIAPDFIDPLTGKSIQQLLEACEDHSRVVKESLSSVPESR
jgi:2-amino-4-hydroxy-6-hydroxymethyldihydropteridine diphosphokinase